MGLSMAIAIWGLVCMRACMVPLTWYRIYRRPSPAYISVASWVSVEWVSGGNGDLLYALMYLVFSQLLSLPWLPDILVPRSERRGPC